MYMSNEDDVPTRFGFPVPFERASLVFEKYRRIGQYRYEDLRDEVMREVIQEHKKTVDDYERLLKAQAKRYEDLIVKRSIAQARR